MIFEPTREAGLRHLADFTSGSLRDYTLQRNFDFGPTRRGNVSQLSPYIRHRLVPEWEVVDAALGRYAVSTVEKFVQEVCWRTYFKGWLEQRPAIWQRYLDELHGLRMSSRPDGALGAALERATAGRTGIDCFDFWAQELVTTGYLHNHARMWFASIWTYTLGLPWQLGADFFMKHLLDGDAASNTLSWRWVCGLHTVGKTYLARRDNIVRYTQGRFDPGATLSAHAPAMRAESLPPPAGLRALRSIPASGSLTVLLSEEDLAPETLTIPVERVTCVIAIDTTDAYPGLSELVKQFKRTALRDALARARQHFGAAGGFDDLVAPSELPAILAAAGDTATVVSEMPTGPARSQILDALAARGSEVAPPVEVRRAWDAAFWPHATGDFHKLEARIPVILRALSLASLHKGSMSRSGDQQTTVGPGSLSLAGSWQRGAH